MHLLVVGGGSAGHVIPALPVMARMQGEGAKVSFIGTRSGLEEELIAQSGADYFAISTGKLRRYASLENFFDLFRIVAGLVQAWCIIGRIRPRIVFSKGGFVAFPVVFAAWLRRVPVVAHESDLTPGLANRLCLPFVATLCTSFAQTQFSTSRLFGFRGQTVYTGAPLRPELDCGDAKKGRASLAFEDPKPILLVTGGSLGAEALNHVIRDALDELTDQFNVVHICGVRKLSDISMPGYRQFEYVDAGWGDLIAAADVVVSRAGANALFELLSLRKVCLLVPLSALASRGDQIANARHMQERGLVEVLQESELTPASLITALNRLRDREQLLAQRLLEFEIPDAVAKLCDELNRAARPTV